jgi:hypothetical protein
LLQLVTNIFRQLSAHCGVPQAGIEPLAMGVMSTAKVRPTFKAPALMGSKLIPEPVVVVPVMLVEVELVFHPAGTVLPVGQLPVDVSLKYHLHE